MFITTKSLVEKFNLNITGVIHVGGHIGEEIKSYKEFTINIHIFEPIEECFRQIPEDVKKYRVALGDKKEYLFLNLANNNQSSSILKPTGHLEEHPSIEFNSKIMVQVDTLDSYGIKDCNFLNMDVQGYEMKVLKGAEETLTHIDYIYTEVNTKELYANCVLQEDLENYLSQRGYKKLWEYMTPHGWGDAFYSRI